MQAKALNIAVPAPAADEAFTGFDMPALPTPVAYHTMNAVVVPRPIAFVTSLGPDDVVNGAPFSYFAGVTSRPPMISIAVARREGVPKDTARNIRERGHFVVNVCSVAMAKAISVAAGDFPPDQSEVELTGLELLPSFKVETPRVANAPVHLECALDQVVEVGRGPVDLLLAEVVYLHVRSDLLDDRGRVDVAKVDPLARLAGTEYAQLHGFFKVPRGIPREN